MATEFKIEKGTIQEPINYFNFDSYCRTKVASATLEEMYSNSEKMNAYVFDFIDALRKNPGYESSRYVALRFDDMRVTDMVKTWDFEKYNHKMEFYVHPNLDYVILVVYT